MKGTFTVVEGVDGAGKGTVISHLEKAFKGQNVLFTREPGGTALGEKLRELLQSETMDVLSEFYLFCISRREHLLHVITPALESGTHVICDRFDASTYAYQVYARGDGAYRELFTVAHEAILGDVRPDCYIFLDVPTEVAMKRLEGRPGEKSKFDKAEAEFHARVREGYIEFMKGFPHVVVDGTPEPAIVCAEAEREVRLIIGL